MNPSIDLQIACEAPLPVANERLIAWAQRTLDEHHNDQELTLRLVDIAEMSELNHSYRQKDGPTNVLAFPSELPEEIRLDCAYLGDVIVCPAVLDQEATEQERDREAHWAHIVIHGVLHLLGYDHYEEDETRTMQAMEAKLLAGFGFPNPYQREGNGFE